MRGSVLVAGAVLAVTVVSAQAADRGPEGMVLIPAGNFMMGSNKADTEDKAQEFGTTKPWYEDEHPKRLVKLPAYWIDRDEVTNAQFRDFVIEKNYWIPKGWEGNGYLLNREILAIATLEKLRYLAAEVYRLDMDTRAMDKEALLTAIEEHQRQLDPLPVSGVNWQSAYDYCAWKGRRLPSEAEWEKAARGEQALEYPWGNDWDEERLNAGGGDRWEHHVAPVGSYPGGRSPYGVEDMAGNVMEWVQDWYGPYPGTKVTNDAMGEKYKVARGGGWGGVGHYVISHFYRAAYRFYLAPDATFVDLGFRCAKSID